MALFRSAACLKQNPLSVWNRTQARNSAIRQLALGRSSRRSPVSCQRETLRRNPMQILVLTSVHNSLNHLLGIQLTYRAVRRSKTMLGLATAKPISATAQTLVRCPIESVFVFVGHDFFQNYTRWCPQVIELEPLSDGPVRA